jgi:hypothetical protein
MYSGNRNRLLATAAGVSLVILVAGGVFGFSAWRNHLADASIPVPHSRWLAQCTAIPVSAVDGLTVERVTVRQGRLNASLRAGKTRGWLQAHRLGTLSGAGVWAVRGPTALRDRMAQAPECSRVVSWSQVGALPSVAKAWIAERSTCCGLATLGGREFRAWPCSWGVVASEHHRPGLAVQQLAGYGPGIVGARGPCADYEVE